MSRPVFDAASCPLQGVNLIEANAGTGKTFQICHLFLRLVLNPERNLPVHQILVVTYTEAATAELRERIRATLEACRYRLNLVLADKDTPKAMETHFGSGAEHLKKIILHEAGASRESLQDAARRLLLALRGFDEAPIFTVHGFCRRVLEENAFEGGIPLEAELVTDQDDLVREAAADFWRKNMYGAGPEVFLAYLCQRNLGPDSFLKLMYKKINQPDLRLAPDSRETAETLRQFDLAALERDFLAAAAAVFTEWNGRPEVRSRVSEILRTSTSLNRNKYRPDSVEKLLAKLDEYALSGPVPPPPFDGFEKFTQTVIQSSVKKNQPVPTHGFFLLCDELARCAAPLSRALEALLLHYQARLLEEMPADLLARKTRRKVRSFDDLLTAVRQAVRQSAEAPGGGGGEDGLSAAIRSRYRVVLVDEFQDTDPVQYEIFHTLFGGLDAALFLIGDPKQAIYGFRGADIFTYLEASRRSPLSYQLDVNHRSEPPLIAAVNRLFQRVQAPFVLPDLRYHESRAPDGAAAPGLETPGQPKRHLQIWAADQGQYGPAFAETAGRAVAAEICRLLGSGGAGPSRLDGRPLQARDCAVLVRKNREARLLQEILRQSGIPSVLDITENIFDSPEAGEMEHLLAGVAEPSNAAALRAALATSLIGLSGNDLAASRDWEAWAQQFRTYHSVWQTAGFIRMLYRLLQEQSVRSRLLARPDGERRLTNVLHLAEILHRRSLEKNLGPSGLRQWLAEQRDPATARLEEHQLRLETDENSVRLVTVHKSKGLEYPVVFCPFAGAEHSRSTAEFIYHDPSAPLTAVLDHGSDQAPAHRLQEEQERLAEEIRLLYVALTRAKNRCYLVWETGRGYRKTALAYLLGHAAGDAAGEIDFARIQTDLAQLAGDPKNGITVSVLPPATGAHLAPPAAETSPLQVRIFSGNIDRSWRIASFSSLTASPHPTEQAADYGEAFTPAPKTGSGHTVFSLPAGANPGKLIHEIFELHDFTGKSALPALVAEKSALYGLASEWNPVLCTLVEDTLRAPLPVSGKPFALQGLPGAARLNELEFYFPLRALDRAGLADIFRRAQTPCSAAFPDRIEGLSFNPSKGYIKGVIDLVFRHEGKFYLVDWKSNLLGDAPENYQTANLAAVMEKDFYLLQYHLYVLALHRYMKHRLPDYEYEKHFGGVFYLFLRGLRPEWPGAGIFYDRPKLELIKTMEERLMGT